jgi:hypothetical protein
MMETHPISDPKDIAPPKFGYNFPKKKIVETEFINAHEDFVKPQNPIAKRTTGYNKGHIRTMLQLDTFGPEHHKRVTESRQRGTTPHSPNPDRFEESSLGSTSRSRPNTGESVHSNSTSNSMVSSKPNVQMQDILSASVKLMNFPVRPMSPEIEDVLMDGHITEKYNVDPHANSVKWFKHYKQSQEVSEVMLYIYILLLLLYRSIIFIFNFVLYC